MLKKGFSDLTVRRARKLLPSHAGEDEMQDKAWAALLSHIPAERHDNLMLVTRSSTEIAIQSILRIDRQFVALKAVWPAARTPGGCSSSPFPKSTTWDSRRRFARTSSTNSSAASKCRPRTNRCAVAVERPVPTAIVTDAPEPEPASGGSLAARLASTVWTWPGTPPADTPGWCRQGGTIWACGRTPPTDHP